MRILLFINKNYKYSGYNKGDKMLKICSDCDQELNISNFSLANKHKNKHYYSPRCKKCTSERNKKHYNNMSPELKEKRRLANIKHYYDNQEKYQKMAREKTQKTPINERLMKSTNDNAKRKNIEHSLKIEDIIIPSICPVLEIPLDCRDKDHTPSVDRIINSKGYTKENIKIISYRANRIKNNSTPEELLKIYNYFSQTAS